MSSHAPRHSNARTDVCWSMKLLPALLADNVDASERSMGQQSSVSQQCQELQQIPP